MCRQRFSLYSSREDLDPNFSNAGSPSKAEMYLQWRASSRPRAVRERQPCSWSERISQWPKWATADSFKIVVGEVISWGGKGTSWMQVPRSQMSTESAGRGSLALRVRLAGRGPCWCRQLDSPGPVVLVLDKVWDRSTGPSPKRVSVRESLELTWNYCDRPLSFKGRLCVWDFGQLEYCNWPLISCFLGFFSRLSCLDF